MIRDNPHHREAIADAFMLIADQMEPCMDCGNRQGQDAKKEIIDGDDFEPVNVMRFSAKVIEPDDNPETGA